LLFRHSDDQLLGYVGINEIVRGPFQSAYVGYWIGSAHSGQGYMTEGLALAVAHAFDTLGLHRLEANIMPSNAPSKALVRRLGFHQEGFSPRYLEIAGRWEDHERWTLLVEDWREGGGPT
jgi:ribosomal-protein-alanine N-acetyltransferase